MTVEHCVVNSIVTEGSHLVFLMEMQTIKCLNDVFFFFNCVIAAFSWLRFDTMQSGYMMLLLLSHFGISL